MSCCVIVEPPWTTLPARRSSQSARVIPIGSMPPCSQKRLSSTATVAFGSHGLIRDHFTGCRFRSDGIEPRREPSAA